MRQQYSEPRRELIVNLARDGQTTPSNRKREAARYFLTASMDHAQLHGGLRPYLADGLGQAPPEPAERHDAHVGQAEVAQLSQDGHPCFGGLPIDPGPRTEHTAKLGHPQLIQDVTRLGD